MCAPSLLSKRSEQCSLLTAALPRSVRWAPQFAFHQCVAWAGILTAAWLEFNADQREPRGDHFALLVAGPNPARVWVDPLCAALCWVLPKSGVYTSEWTSIYRYSRKRAWYGAISVLYFTLQMNLWCIFKGRLCMPIQGRQWQIPPHCPMPLSILVLGLDTISVFVKTVGLSSAICFSCVFSFSQLSVQFSFLGSKCLCLGGIKNVSQMQRRWPREAWAMCAGSKHRLFCTRLLCTTPCTLVNTNWGDSSWRGV